ncbi:hypothetical protein A1O3_04980, partial [Capronia epimyces CBS 606.96]
VKAAVDSRAPCRTISEEFLDTDLVESERLNQDIMGAITCPNHQNFVGKVRLRIEGIGCSIDDRAVYCVVKDNHRELILNVSDSDINAKPALLPFGL